MDLNATDPHSGDTYTGHSHGPNLKTYLGIFVVLSVCTLLSFVANAVMGQNQASMGVIMIIAVIKALCVAAIFMHLKFEFNKLYFLIIPVMIQ